jgi:hypothetical protein
MPTSPPPVDRQSCTGGVPRGTPLVSFRVLPGYFFAGVNGWENSSSDEMTLLVGELDETGRRIIREVIRGILLQAR